MNHFMAVKIYYEDTDCGGVVYYANYLRYMERARTEYLANRGYSVKNLMDEGTIFMVLRAEIDYRAPAVRGYSRSRPGFQTSSKSPWSLTTP
jgi:acyl-CoA thioester hydrolase